MLIQLYSNMGVDLVQTFGSLDTAGLYMLINAGGCLVAGVLLLLVYTTRQPKFPAGAVGRLGFGWYRTGGAGWHKSHLPGGGGLRLRDAAASAAPTAAAQRIE